MNSEEYWDAIHQYSSGGAYSNFMMDEGQERVKASYKHNYDRLVEIKRKYDPNNFFSVNQNINPSDQSS
jgi:FAD/FMN-containing dehydrogenase